MKTLSLSAILLFTLALSVGVFAQTQNALDFDGSNDHVVIGQPSSLNFDPDADALSVEVWFRVQADENGSFVSKGYGAGATFHQFQVGYSASDLVFAEIGAVRINGTQQYDDGNWHHACVTSNGTTFRLYVDGVLENSGSPGSYTGNIDWLIGARRDLNNTGTDFLFTGLLDEVRIWDIQLTVAQIRNNMYREIPNPASEPNLIAYYKFNETTGTILPDESANSNDGTLLNMDPTTDWVVSTAPIPYYSVNNGAWNNNSSWASGQNAPANTWARVVVFNDLAVATNATVEQLTVDMAGTLTVNPAYSLTVNGDLNNQAGPGGLIVGANASDMGSLIHNTVAVEGTVQQYLSEDQWHFVSPPVANAVSGVYTDIYLIEWSEPDSLWSFIVPVNIPLNVTEGYGAWASSGITGSTTVQYQGTLNTGNYAPVLTYNNNPGEGQGWNLIGNPYPSSLAWNNNWVTANVDATCYVWDGVQYLTWNRLTGIGTKGNGIIPVSQGFYVKANNINPAITIPQSERVHSNQAFYKSDNTGVSFDFIVEGNGYSDKAILSFNPEATDNFDNNFDAYKLMGIAEAPQVYFTAGNNLLSVDVLSELHENLVVNMGFNTGVAGKYAIKMNQLAEIPGNLQVYLEDVFTGKVINISETNQYFFSANEGANETRFRIHFKNPGSHIINTGTSDLSDYLIKVSDNNVRIDFNGQVTGEAKVYNMLGQLLESRRLNNAETVEFNGLEADGVAILEINTQEKSSTEKIFLR